MDVREAVKTAKTHVTQLFADERLSDLGLEEVEFDDSSGTWSVTVGFSCPWDRSEASPVAALAGAARPSLRSYKVVRIDDAGGRVVSVEAREVKS